MKTNDRAGTLPRHWEHAFGYDGEARYVAFYWTPVGDEAVYDDGQTSGDGNWHLFLAWRRQRPDVDRRYNLGDSETDADHWLVLDRETRDVAVLTRAEARVVLGQQWPTPGAPIELSDLDWALIKEAVCQAMARAEAAMRVIQRCETCMRSIAPGWLRAEDGGFDRCPECQGWGFLPAPGEATERALQEAEAPL
ncbi:MAG: hypothetical protein JXA93_04960 [Anaerolineae bacterium]|nr:hypothetical protein [Anaerolineae bacterium]